MKHETPLKQCIEVVKKAVRDYQLTPAQYRYVTKQVRNQLNLKTMLTPKRLPDFLNPAETHSFINKAYEKSAETGLLCKFLIYTGLRISEARNLLINNIDLSNNQIKVVEGKGKKDRFVPLAVTLGHDIRHHLNERSKGYLFAKKNETPYTIRALQYKVENVIKDCAFTKELSTHSLRHTFACMCLSRGLTLEQIKLFMGHSHVETTEIYAKLELGAVKDEFLRLTGGV